MERLPTSVELEATNVEAISLRQTPQKYTRSTITEFQIYENYTRYKNVGQSSTSSQYEILMSGAI